MSDIVFKLVADPSGLTQGFAAADAAVTKLNKGIAETEQASKDASDVAVNGGKKMNDEFDKTTKKTQSLKSKLRELKAQLADATDPKDIERLSKAAGALADQIGDAADAAAVFATDSPFEAVGNGIGSVAQKLRNLDFKGAAAQSNLLLAATKGITLKEGIAGFKDLGKTALNIGKSLLLNPLFLIPALIVLIVSNFNELKNAGGLVGDTFTSIGKAIGIVIDLGKDFLDLIGLIDSTKKSLDQVIKSNDALLVSINARYDNEIAKAKLAGKNTDDLELAKAKAAIHSNNIALMATNERYRLGQIDAKDYAERIRAIEISSSKASLDLINLQVAQKEKADAKLKAAQEKANANYMKNQEAFKQALLDLEKRAQQAELSGLTGEAKLKFQRDLSEKEIKLLEETLIKKSIAAGKGNKLGLEQEAEFATLRKAIKQEYYNGVLQLEIQAAQKQAQIQKNKNDGALANLELENTIVKNSIEAIRSREGDSAREIEALNEEKNRMLLQQELSYQLEKEKLVIEGIEKDKAVKVDGLVAELAILQTRTDAISQARVKAIEEEIAAINLNSELAKTAATSSVQNIVTGIQEELNKPKPKVDYVKLLGLDNKEIALFLNANFDTKLNPEDVQKAKDALSQLASSLQTIMSAYFASEQKRLDQELSDNQKRIDQRDENIRNLEENLNKEKDLYDKGYANNMQRVQNAITEQQKLKARDLENEKRLKEEKKKLAKQQLDLDTIVQASNLVVGISKVFETYAAVPYVAAILAAGMIGAFVYTKSLAYEAANKDNNFAKGVVDLQGPGTETSDSIPSNLSAHESVVTAKGTRKAKTLLKGLNADDNFLIEKGIAELLKNTGVSLSNIPTELQNKKQTIRDAEYLLNFSSNNKGVESKLDDLRNEFKKISNQETRTILPDGRLMIKKGLNTTYIKKKNER